VEHLAALRAIPNLALIRPCDAHEVREAWRAALLRNDRPTAFALSRQKVAVIDRKQFADARGLHKGAYVLAEAENKQGRAVGPKLILIGTGSEIGLAMQAREKLNKQGIPTRVVSMPCWEFFDQQTPKYKESVLPARVRARLSIEAGVSLGWAKYVGDNGDSLAVDRFGQSAPAEDVFRDYGFTVENVIRKAKRLV
jgi:transketolase